MGNQLGDEIYAHARIGVALKSKDPTMASRHDKPKAMASG